MTSADLISMYKTNILMKEYGYNIEEIETMIPWEREIYLSLIKQRIEEKIEKQKEYDRSNR